MGRDRGKEGMRSRVERKIRKKRKVEHGNLTVGEIKGSKTTTTTTKK